MSKISVDYKRCKGCFLCVSVCPKNALTPSKELGAKGYEIVHLDGEKCIGCGSCYRMCPDYCIEITD
jgi:2-oxoglutarate ferredoxin oxidoreductase subunit delta